MEAQDIGKKMQNQKQLSGYAFLALDSNNRSYVHKRMFIQQQARGHMILTHSSALGSRRSANSLLLGMKKMLWFSQIFKHLLHF